MAVPSKTIEDAQKKAQARLSEDALLKQLKNPFDPKFIKWRVGATNKDKSLGIALAYLDAREVSKRLDDVCGLGGWQNHYKTIDGGLICEISIKMPGGEWVTKSNAAGHTKVEAIKGGASDAFKRAASTWGIGRYLYYLPNVWTPIQAKGNSYELKEMPELPKWALPDSGIERWEDVAAKEFEQGQDTYTEEDITDMLSDDSNRQMVMDVLSKMSPEQAAKVKALTGQNDENKSKNS